MNERTTIYIEGKDNTGPAVKSATKNFSDLNKEVQKDYENYRGTLINTRAIRERAKESKFSYAELLASHKKTIDGENALINKHRQAGQAAVQAGQQGGAAFKFFGAQIPPIVGGLAKMAGGALTAYEALNQLKQGFMGFAEFDNQLRLTRNQTGLSEQKIHNLGTEMKRLAQITGVSAKELLESFNEIREAGNFTPEEALKMMPDLTTAANGAGANAKLFNRAVGDIMRNLKIPADQYKFVMEAFSHANREFNINIEEMGPRLSQATAYMATWGYQGVDAAQRAVTLFGILKEGTGSAARAGTALIGILGDLGNDRMGKALGFGAGQLEKYLRSVKDPIGELISLMTQADNQDLVMKALDIQDKASYTKLMGELRTFADKLKGVREAQGAVAAGKYVEAGPLFAIKRLMVSLDALRDSLGMLLDAIGVTASIKGLADAMAAIAISVERIVGGLKYIVGLSDVMPKGMPKTLGEAKYRLWAKSSADYGGDSLEPIVPYADYERGGQEYYDKTLKAWEEKNAKETAEAKAKAMKEKQEAADKEYNEWAEDTKKRFPGYVIPERPGRPGTGVGPMSPLHDPSARPRLLPTPLLPTPSGRPEGMLQKMGEALDDTTKKLVSFAEALPDSERAQIVKAAFTTRGEGAGEGRTYGGSGDARVLPASYTPSGRGYLWGGPGGARGPGDTGTGGAGPGGLGTDYGPRGSLGPTTGPTTGPQGGSGGSFLDALADIESGNKNIPSRVDPDIGGVPGSKSQGYFQINTPTWRDFAGKAGVDLNQYPNAMSAPREVQARVASVIPFKRFGPQTQLKMRQKFGPIDSNQTVGDLAAKHGTGYTPAALPPSDGTGAGAVATPPTGAGGGVEEAQGKVARTRKGVLDPQLREALDYAAAASGVNVRVTSGGQRMHGAPGATGSHRHDKGRAADLDVIDPKTGKVLALDDPRRLKFLEEAAAAGAGGTGTRYMDDPSKIHVGITGDRAIVGQGLGPYAGPAHERDAVNRGLRRMMTPAQVAAARKAQIEARAGARGPAPMAGYNAGAPGLGKGLGPTQGPGFGGAQDTSQPNRVPKATPAPAAEEGATNVGFTDPKFGDALVDPLPPLHPAIGAVKRGGDVQQDTDEEMMERVRRGQERNKQIDVNLKVNDAQVQFARTSMRRSADREVREARWNSYSDIGAA